MTSIQSLPPQQQAQQVAAAQDSTPLIDTPTLILIHVATVFLACGWIAFFGASKSDGITYYTTGTMLAVLVMLGVHSAVLSYLAYNPGHPQENTVRHLLIVWLLLVCLLIYIRQ